MKTEKESYTLIYDKFKKFSQSDVYLNEDIIKRNWQVIRLSLIRAILKNKGVHGSAQAVNKTALSFLNYLIFSLLSLIGCFCCLIRGRVDYIVVGHPRKKKFDSGSIGDQYSQPVIEFISKRFGLKGLIFQRADKRKPEYRNLSKFVYLDGLDILKRVLSFFIISFLFFNASVGARRLKINDSFDTTLNRSLLCRLLANSIASFWVEFYFYRAFFKLTRPKFIFVVCGYENLAVFKAAKLSGITSIELQHGASINQYHIGYAKDNVKYRPDRFFNFGRFWNQSEPYGLAKKSMDALGNKAFWDGVSKHGVDLDAESSQNVLIVSQGTVSKYLYGVAELITASGVRATFRLHPGELVSDKVDYKLIDISTGKQSIIEALKNKPLVIGVYSTALYEAASLGCKVIILKAPGWENMINFIDSKYGILFDPDIESWEDIYLRSLTLDQGPSLFSNFNPECILRLVESVNE
jgi:hypothetical protein